MKRNIYNIPKYLIFGLLLYGKIYSQDSDYKFTSDTIYYETGANYFIHPTVTNYSGDSLFVTNVKIINNNFPEINMAEFYVIDKKIEIEPYIHVYPSKRIRVGFFVSKNYGNFDFDIEITTSSKKKTIDTAKLVFLQYTSTVNEPYKNNFSITPNPASDFIEISIPELNKGLQPLVQNVQIFNTLGIEVAQTPSSVNTVNSAGNFAQTGASELLKIDISNLPTGVYFIKIGDKVEKFVKM